ncbi:MAG: DNA-directed RNA polymerase subunit omega [Myxococcales bacterium]|nr:DNA-directed RNA polymerase subunit omega [Myxococcales bacterium]MCB9521839.1 DNA-directed RNA polymerase subunit omega [Myxococcales bacterium]
MARVTVEDCLEHVDDQFALVHLAARRYRQLHRGSLRLVDSKNKDIVTALREIAAGKVGFRENVRETVMKANQDPQERAMEAAAQAALDELELDATPLI